MTINRIPPPMSLTVKIFVLQCNSKCISIVHRPKLIYVCGTCKTMCLGIINIDKLRDFLKENYKRQPRFSYIYKGEGSTVILHSQF